MRVALGGELSETDWVPALQLESAMKRHRHAPPSRQQDSARPTPAGLDFGSNHDAQQMLGAGASEDESSLLLDQVTDESHLPAAGAKAAKADAPAAGAKAAEVDAPQGEVTEDKAKEEVAEEEVAEEEVPTVAPAEVDETVAEPGGPPSGGAPAGPGGPPTTPDGGGGGGAAPGGGGGGGGGPSGGGPVDVRAADPVVADACAPGRTVDGVTDYYMEVHWEETAFHGIAHQVGYPDDVSSDAVSTVDMLMPADTSPEVRAMVDVMCAAASGFFDDYAISKAAEMMGFSGEFVHGLIDIGSTAADYVELEDPVGLTLFGGKLAMEGILAGADAVLTSVSEKLSTLSSISMAISAAIAVIGQLPAAAATAVANAAGFATVELLVAELTAAAAAISATLQALKMPVQALIAVVDVLRGSLDVLAYMYNEYSANQAEAAGRFDKAAQYRDLMRGNVFDVLTDWLNATVNALLVIPYASTVKTVGVVGVNLLTGGPSLDVATWKGPTIEGVVGAGEILTDAVAGTEWWNDAAAAQPASLGPIDGADLADPMRVVEGAPYVARPTATGTSATIDAARSRTVGWLATSWSSLQGDDPSWYQTLVNDIASPDDGPSYDEATSPAFWLGQLLQGMPFVAEYLADTSLEGIAAGCEAAASALPGTQPLFDAVSLMVLGLKPELELVMSELNRVVQEQSVDLSRLEEISTDLEAGLADLRTMADPVDEIKTSADSMIASLESMRLDPSQFDLPAWAPVSIVDSVIDPLNAGIDAAIDEVRDMADATAERWREHVTGMIAAMEAKVAEFHAQVAEGGSFRAELEATVASFQASVAEADIALREWDGVLTFDVAAAVSFLTSTAAAARAAAAEDAARASQGDPWPQILCDVAQPAVDSWRARHQADVESQYQPPIPTWEVEACRAVYAEVMADPSVSEDAKAAVESAWQAVSAQSGGIGRDALYAFWAAEAELSSAVSAAGHG